MFLVKTKNTVSVIRQHFGLPASQEGIIVDKEQDKPVCQKCSRSMQAKGCNATNLFQHLREHYLTIYAEVTSKVVPKQQASVQTSLSDAVVFAIVTMIVIFLVDNNRMTFF